MHSPTIKPSYAQPLQAATPDNNFNTQLVEIRITAAVLTAKGVGGVKYGKWTAELTVGDDQKEISATDEHQTIHTRGAVLAAVAGLGALKRRCAVQIHSDSTYLLEGTTWLAMNLALGWHTGKKAGRIRNHALWSQLRDLSARHDVQWIGPRKVQSEFADIMSDIKTEIWRRTIGEGQDAGYLYSGHASGSSLHVLPWDDSLGEYRAFTDDEKSSDVCLNVGNTDDNAVTPLTAKEREARKRVIARIAKHYQPEYIHPAQRKPSDTTAAPPATTSRAEGSGADTASTLEPAKVRQIFAAFESPAGTVTLLKYPRADARFRYPTSKTARLELEIGT